MGDRIRKWIAVLLAGSILAMIQLVPAGGTVFVRGNIENKGILGEKETSLQQTLHARAWVLMDADSGRILAGKDADTAYPMASTTKILTCILALEQGNPDDWVEVSEKAASMPDVQLNMRAGERYRLSDLLYSLMLESHNDSAVAVAEHIGGSVEEFAEKMNRKAWEIGCKNVCFVTPNGLDVADADGNEHSASAADMARIMRYCIKESPKADQFLKITGEAEYTFTDVSGKYAYHCYNHNAFLKMMDGAVSGKTGFTGNAGYCYVGALEQNGKTYIVALLACGWPNNRTYKWSDTRKLMEYGLAAYERCDLDDIALDGSRFAPVPIEHAQGGRIGEQVYMKLHAVLKKDLSHALLREGEQVTVEYRIAQKLSAPVKKGSCAGAIYYKLGGMVLREYQVETTEDMEKLDFEWCLRQVLKLAV